MTSAALWPARTPASRPSSLAHSLRRPHKPELATSFILVPADRGGPALMRSLAASAALDSQVLGSSLAAPTRRRERRTGEAASVLRPRRRHRLIAGSAAAYRRRVHRGHGAAHGMPSGEAETGHAGRSVPARSATR